MSEAVVHPTADVEHGVSLGARTRVWNQAHLRAPSRIGADCIIGEKTYIAGHVELCDRVKVNSFVYICSLVTLETGVMVAAGACFTNDRYPRATTPDLARLRGSEVDEHSLPTVVREGATVGARALVGCGLEIGRFAMVGMGAVVTRTVPPFALVVGVPARPVAHVCRCGRTLGRLGALDCGEIRCQACGRCYAMRDGDVVEIDAV
jgi:acetyltransferase-like isoleucine patch superfamily enzyme